MILARHGLERKFDRRPAVRAATMLGPAITNDKAAAANLVTETGVAAAAYRHRREDAGGELG